MMRERFLCRVVKEHLCTDTVTLLGLQSLCVTTAEPFLWQVIEEVSAPDGYLAFDSHWSRLFVASVCLISISSSLHGFLLIGTVYTVRQVVFYIKSSMRL